VSEPIPAAPAPRKRRRLLPALLLLALLAAGAWFVAFFWPYDPAALPRAVPAGTRFVLRAENLPEALDECLLNPLVRVFLASAGVPDRTVSDLANDPETRKWLEKLSGKECLFGLWDDGLFGASFLGAGAARLRWQIQLFRPAGMTRLANGGWRIDDDLDLPEGLRLHFALEDGCLFAWLGETASGLDACLAAARGQGARLWDGERDAALPAFLSSPAEAGTLRAWTAPLAPWGLDTPALMELAVSPATAALTAAAPAAGSLAGVPAASGADDLPPVAFAGDAVLALSADKALFPWLGERFGEQLLPWARHVLSLAGEFAEGPVRGFLLTGSHGGRLTLGLLRHFGRGLKVPALLLVSKASDEAATRAAVDRALAESNRRYRGRFFFTSDADGVHRLASEDAGEWTELLSDDDRPAWALRDGWLFVCSSASALRRVLSEGGSAADEPWAASLREGRGALSAWGDLVAFEAALRDWIGLYQTACGFMGLVRGEDERRQLRALRAWGEELRGFGTLEAAFAGGDDGAWASLVLGDAAAPAASPLLAALPESGTAIPAAAAPGEEIPPVAPVPVAPRVATP